MNLLAGPGCLRHRGGAEGVSLLRNHIVLMLIYAIATALFFALLWKNGRRERDPLLPPGVLLSLFVGGIALAWAMYPFPLR